MVKKKAAQKSVQQPVQRRQREPSDLPPRPPQDLREAVLFGALSEITPEVEQAYVEFFYRIPDKKLSEAQKKKGAEAVMMMSTVGFAFNNWQKGRAE